MATDPRDPNKLRAGIMMMVQDIQDRALIRNAQRDVLTGEERADYEWLCHRLYTDKGFDEEAPPQVIERYQMLEAKITQLTRRH